MALLHVTEVVRVLRGDEALAFAEPTVEIFAVEDLLEELLNAYVLRQRQPRGRKARAVPSGMRAKRTHVSLEGERRSDLLADRAGGKMGLAEMQMAVKNKRLLIKGRQMALLSLRGVLKKAFAAHEQTLAKPPNGPMSALEEEAAALREEILFLQESHETLRQQLEALVKQPPREPPSILPVRFHLASNAWLVLLACVALGKHDDDVELR